MIRNIKTSLFFFFSVQRILSTHQVVMSRGLLCMLRLPIIAIVFIATIHFTGLYKYEVELVKKATMNVSGEINVN